LNEADQDMLDWLITNANLIEGEDNNAAYFGGLYQAAIPFKGDEEGVRRFLRSRSTARRALASSAVGEVQAVREVADRRAINALFVAFSR
jgi:hypothetical protein